MPGHEAAPANDSRQLWAFNAGIAIGNLMAQATAMGLIAHPMAGIEEDAVRAAFGAPAELRVLVVVALGYPGDPRSLRADLQERETAPQRRLPLDRIVVEDRWQREHGESARSRR
jgi:nitroreductase